MNLIGGLDMYAEYGTRYLSSDSPYGRKVIYLDEGGYDCERKMARKCFNKGKVLTVKEIYVGRSSSDVEFIEFPNMKFNTVMFEDILSGKGVKHDKY